jgi:hypothetical protein
MILALLLAAAAAADPPICTDRPGKGNGVCTVPAGRIQIETQTVGWSRFEQGGVDSDTWSVGGSVLKYGISERSDLQIGWTPYVRIKSGGHSISGVGDIVVRLKQRLTADDAKVQVALIPFAKLPTAKRPIGNRKVEGGLAVPFSFSLGGATATFGPEVDVLADGEGQGRHAALINLVNLSGAVAPRLTLAAELWSNLNFDPAGTVKQASADAAIAYALSNEMQLDGGVNVGLTKDTADLELYTGISLRF